MPETTDDLDSDGSSYVKVTPNRRVRIPSSPSKRNFTKKLDQLMEYDTVQQGITTIFFL